MSKLARNEEIVRLRTGGRSVAELAQRFEVSRRTVQRVLAKGGFKGE